jgi:peptidoglycan/LPS O-acetylase OafA/YrhL
MNRSAEGKTGFVSSLPPNLKSGLESSQLPALDGVRAVAAFLVVFYHFGFTKISGGMGVLIFFVLSGFLITWLLLKEDEKFGTVSLRNFYSRRGLRIFPAFYCYWLFYIALLIVRHRQILWGQAMASFFYVNNYFQAIKGDPNTGLSHTWSLGIEEQFYLLWATGFLLLRKNRKRIAWALAGIIGSIWIYRELLVFVFKVHQGYMYEAFDTRADHLLIGCLMAVMLRSEFASKVWTAICSNVLFSLVPVLLLVASVACADMYGALYRDAIGFIVDPVLVAILITQAIAFRGTVIWAWSNFAWVRFLGRISYSIYLYQQIVLEPARKVLASYPVVVQLVAAIMAVVLTASGSYYIIERPFLKLKERFYTKTATA